MFNKHGLQVIKGNGALNGGDLVKTLNSIARPHLVTGEEMTTVPVMGHLLYMDLRTLRIGPEFSKSKTVRLFTDSIHS